MPQAECRRVVLYSSIQAATLARACALVVKCSIRRSSNSRVECHDSMTALSRADPGRPIDWEMESTLRPRLRAATHATLFGLLAATGLRLGEAIGLERDDVDLQQGLITIRHAKFDRARLVPVHETVTQALGRYVDERDRLCRRPRAQAFFLSSAGTALGRSGVEKVLRQLTTAMGIRTATVRPRAHDLRHLLAVTTLLGWYRDGGDVQARLPLLSTWLGHADPRHTYWYYSDSRVIPTSAPSHA